MSFFRRTPKAQPLPPEESPTSRPAPQGDPDPLGSYADSVTVIVRHTPEMLSGDPDYEVAAVARFAAGGSVPVEALREDIMGWLLDEAEFTAHSEVAFRRRHINAGASGAEAEIVVGLLGGAAGGVAGVLTQQALDFIRGQLAGRTEHLEPMDAALRDLDGMRFAVARAFDIRPSDLSLVEQRASEHEHAAVFEDRAGRVYGVQVDKLGLVIRRLRPGDPSGCSAGS